MEVYGIYVKIVIKHLQGINMGTYLMVYCDGKGCKKEARMLEQVGFSKPLLPVDWNDDYNTGTDIKFGGRNHFHYCPKCWVKVLAEKEVKRKLHQEKMEAFKKDPGDLFRTISNRKNGCEEHF